MASSSCWKRTLHNFHERQSFKNCILIFICVSKLYLSFNLLVLLFVFMFFVCLYLLSIFHFCYNLLSYIYLAFPPYVFVCLIVFAFVGKWKRSCFVCICVVFVVCVFVIVRIYNRILNFWCVCICGKAALLCLWCERIRVSQGLVFVG